MDRATIEALALIYDLLHQPSTQEVHRLHLRMKAHQMLGTYDRNEPEADASERLMEQLLGE